MQQQQPVSSPASATATAGQRRAGVPPPISVDQAAPAASAHGVLPSPSASWMKMLSTTFLGETAGGLFGRKQPLLTDSSPGSQKQAKTKNGLDQTPTFKIALVGGSGVGKTSILRRWLQRPYTSKYSPTIGVDVISVPFRYRNQDVLLSIWDVASVEVDSSQSALHSLICDELDGIFFVFNVHRVSSIAAVDKWRYSLAKHISAKEIPFYLLAHKADLIQKRIMSSDDIASYAKAGGYKGWMWTVGRSNFGENDKNPAVLEALERMVDSMWKERERKPRAVSRPMGLFDSPDKPRLEVIQVNADLHNFSASLLRIPTKAITTLPRGEDLQPIDEEFPPRRGRGSETDSTQDVHRRSSFGGNWVLGTDKGLYLRVTEDSVVADHEESEEEEQESEEEKNSEESAEVTTEAGSGQADQPDVDGGGGADAEARTDAEPRSQQESKVGEGEPETEATPKPPTSSMSDHDAWRFFAGSISRARAESILRGREPGTFLLRRKDAQTLILSYMGPDHVHHALIEYKGQKYHVGSAKSSQASFATLSRCLRSVRKYANRGLVFSRNTDFRVVNKDEMDLEEDVHKKLQITTTASTSAWRPGSANVTPTTAIKRGVLPKRPGKRPSSGLLAQQEHVHVPPNDRINEVSGAFYQQLTDQLKTYAAQQAKHTDAPENEDEINYSSPVDAASLLDMVENERKQLQSMGASDPEGQWRQLVKNMELWNRIVANLEISLV